MRQRAEQNGYSAGSRAGDSTVAPQEQQTYRNGAGELMRIPPQTIENKATVGAAIHPGRWLSPTVAISLTEVYPAVGRAYRYSLTYSSSFCLASFSICRTRSRVRPTAAPICLSVIFRPLLRP